MQLYLKKPVPVTLNTEPRQARWQNPIAEWPKKLKPFKTLVIAGTLISALSPVATSAKSCSTVSTPLDVVYVVDVSGSMNAGFFGSGSRIAAARAGMLTVNDMIAQENNGSRVGLVTFTSSASVRAGLTPNISSVSRIISGLSAGGGTALHTGVYAATSLLQSSREAAHLPVVILFSDGSTSVSAGKASLDQLHRAIPDAVIYGVGVGQAAAMEVLQYGATVGSGALYMANNASVLTAALQTIIGKTMVCPPVAIDDSAITSHGTAVTVEVLQNDLLEDATPPLTITEASNGSGGNIVVNSNNTITYTPNNSFSGQDEFTYRIQDAAGQKSPNTAKVTISIPKEPLATQCFAVADNDDLRGSPDILMALNKATAAVSTVGWTNTEHVESIAFNLGATQLYAADGDQLGVLDLYNGMFTPKEQTFGVGRGSKGKLVIDDVDGLAFDAMTGILYGTHRTHTKGEKDLLIQIDPETGRLIPNAFGRRKDYLVIDSKEDDIDDIAIDPTNGIIYGAANNDGRGGRLIVIDKRTGKTTPVNLIGNGLGVDNLEGLAFFNDGQLYGVTGNNEGRAETNNKLYRLNLITGRAERLIGEFDDYRDYEAIACLTGEARVLATIDGISGDKSLWLFGDAFWTGLHNALAQVGIVEPIINVEDGKITVLISENQNVFYTRPETESTVVPDPDNTPLGFSTSVENGIEIAVLVFEDEEGNKRQQILFPLPVENEALQSFLETVPEAREVVLHDDGRVSVTIGSVVYEGVFAYDKSLPIGPLQNDRMEMTAVPDANGDGVDDFMVTYPDGSMQILFVLGHVPI